MNNSNLLIDRARLLFEQGRVDDTIRELKNVLQQDPENDEAFAIYARCYYSKNQLDDGITAANQAISLEPHQGYYLYLRAFGYYKKDQHSKARADLNEAIQLDPYNPEFFGLYSFIYLDEKEFQPALEKANEGLELDPENITCLNARSTALNKLRRVDDAIETMQDALAQDPDNEFTHATIGWNCLEKGKHKEAAKHFREALRINPNHTSARAGLKEALKSKIPPYKWLLQYSFWITNKGKNARWIIPIALYIGVRVLAGALGSNESTETAASTIITLYLVFVVTSWIINPLANFFLLFHSDGKYALTSTERYTAITVVSFIILGCVSFVFATLTTEPAEGKVYTPFMITAFAFWLMTVPLGDIEYPLSFNAGGSANKVALILTSLGLLTILLAFVYFPAAIITGAAFIIGFVLNNWLGLFR